MEEFHHKSLFHFFSLIEFRVPMVRFAFHCPNGGYRNAREGAKLKAMGVRAGVPDVLLPVQTHGFAGLAIELKYGKNKLSKEQQLWMLHFSRNGWMPVVAYDWTEAAKATLAYLGENVNDYTFS